MVDKIDSVILQVIVRIGILPDTRGLRRGGLMPAVAPRMPQMFERYILQLSF